MINVRRIYWVPLDPGTEALHAVELTFISWHMPDDAAEGVAEYSFFRLQPSVNLHAQLQPLCSAALVPNVLPRRNEGSGEPCAVIKAL